MSTYPAQNNANSECNSLYSSQHCQYTTTIGPSSRKPCDKIACPGLGREVKAIIQTQIFRIKCFVIHSVAILYTGEWKSYQCRNLTIPWSSKLMLMHYPVLKTLQWEKHTGFQNSDLWSTFREGEHPGACLVCLCLSYMRALCIPWRHLEGISSFMDQQLGNSPMMQETLAPYILPERIQPHTVSDL